MSKIFTPVMGAALALTLVGAPAYAKKAEAPAAAAGTVGGVVVQGIAIANLEAVVANADANRVATQQRPVTYKPQIDNYQARGRALQAQIQPLVDKFNRDAAAPGANRALLQQQGATIQKMQEDAQRELNGIMRPVVYSEAYVTEQIEEKLDQAIKNAMTKKKVTLLLSPQAVLATENAYNLNPDILAELNALLPTAQLVPPQGWEPRQLREARAQQAAAQGQPAAGAAPAATTPAAPRPPAGPQPEGR